MLGKLLKYELKAMGRVMLPLYGVIVAAAAVLAFSMRFSMSAGAKALIDKLAILSSILLVAAVVASIVVMFVLTLQRFYRNLLGTEGYLMFTLPVTTADNILSKLISSVIWVALGLVTGVISGLIMILITGNLPELMKQLEEIWKMITSGQNSALMMENVLMFAFMMLCGTVATLCKIYAAIAIGHQWSSHRVAGAVLAYIGIGIVEVSLSQVPGLRQLFRSGLIYNSSSLGTFSFGACMSLLQAAIYAVITWRLLDRRLNLE